MEVVVSSNHNQFHIPFNLHRSIIDGGLEKKYCALVYDEIIDAGKIPRHHKLLIQAIKGASAEDTSDLMIVKLRGTIYRIQKINGYETVIEPEDEVYITIR